MAVGSQLVPSRAARLHLPPISEADVDDAMGGLLTVLLPSLSTSGLLQDASPSGIDVAVECWCRQDHRLEVC